MPDVPEQYVRRPFYVNAIRVTDDNIDFVADWCGGTIYTGMYHGPNSSTPISYIKVPVIRPISEKQTNATVGDWILSSPKGFKVYNDAAFRKGFEPAEIATGKSVEQTLNDVDEALLRIEERLNAM